MLMLLGTRRRAVGAALAAGLLCVLTACGSGDGGTESSPTTAATTPGQNFTSGDLARFLLQDGDVPSGYKSTERIERTTVDKCLQQPKTGDQQTFVNQLKGFGLTDCAVSKYQQKSRDLTTDLGTIAMRFPDGPSAAKAIPVLKQYTQTGLTGGLQAREIAVQGLGDEAVGYHLEGQVPFDGTMYIWRARNVTSITLGFYFTGGDNDMLEVAKRIDFRATGQTRPTTPQTTATTTRSRVTSRPTTPVTPPRPGGDGSAYEQCIRSGLSEEQCAPFRQ